MAANFDNNKALQALTHSIALLRNAGDNPQDMKRILSKCCADNPASGKYISVQDCQHSVTEASAATQSELSNKDYETPPMEFGLTDDRETDVVLRPGPLE
eukprot:2634176-Rhodomonas_salina.1